MLEYMEAGGAIMWVITFLSVAALAVALERVFFFVRASTDASKLEAAFERALREPGEDAARNVVQASDSSLHRMFRAGLAHWRTDRDSMKLLMEQQVRREVYRWEKHIHFLEIAAKIAPLLGLLGTVLGMSDMFRSLQGSGQIAMDAVTGGIWKALFTTIAGLSAAIPILLAHSLLNGAVDSQEETLSRGADFLLLKHAQGLHDPGRS